MNKVLITGATGFVGSALLKRLGACGVPVRAVVRRKIAGSNLIEPLMMGTINGATEWLNVLNGLDAVVHLAARVHVMKDRASDPLTEFRQMNVEGTLNLARQAAEAGVRRFVYLSSIKVNGESTGVAAGSSVLKVRRAQKKKNSSEFKVLSSKKGQNSAESRVPSVEGMKAFRENDVPDPHDEYATSKWEAEQGLMALARETGMEVVIIRPPLVYGPGVKGNFASMLHWVKKGIPLPLGAVQNNRRSLVALDNLVDLIVTCLEHPKAANEIFLVSDGEDLSTRELLKRIARAYGKPVRLIPVPVSIMQFVAWLLGKQGVSDRLFGSLQVDSSKAREVLGWVPPVSVDEQLQKMVSGSR